MGHRAKHLRRNWVPGRIAAAEERRKVEEKRQADELGRRQAEGQAG